METLEDKILKKLIFKRESYEYQINNQKGCFSLYGNI